MKIWLNSNSETAKYCSKISHVSEQKLDANEYFGWFQIAFRADLGQSALGGLFTIRVNYNTSKTLMSPSYF